VEAVDHVVAPAAVAERLQLQQIAEQVPAHVAVGVVDVAKYVVRVGRASGRAIRRRRFLLGTTLIERRIGDTGGGIAERFVVARDGPQAPRRIPKRGPAARPVAVVQHKIGDGLDALAQQRLEHRAMIVEGAVAVGEFEVLLRPVSRAHLASF
jgi:hypothetical protein